MSGLRWHEIVALMNTTAEGVSSGANAAEPADCTQALALLQHILDTNSHIKVHMVSDISCSRSAAAGAPGVHPAVGGDISRAQHPPHSAHPRSPPVTCSWRLPLLPSSAK